MVDFALSEQQRLLQKTARDFAEREIVPAAAAIRQREPGTSPWDIIRPAFVKAGSLGFTHMLIPEEYGGTGGTALDNVLVMEELGAADIGIAASYFNVTVTSPILLLLGANEDQKKRWLTRIAGSPDFVLASASSEPDVAGADTFCPDPNPAIGLRTLARRDGDSYVISGSKAGFSTNSGAASAYFVMARTDLDKPARESTSLFMIPADAPGLKLGGKTHLIGWKTAMHHDLSLDEVRVPVEDRIGEEGANMMFFFQALPFLSSGLAAAHVGLARAAFDLAFEYASHRISWGRPIIEHQAVALKLADMVADVEAARLMVWQVAWAADRGDPRAAGVLAPAAKTFAVDVAIRNAERAVKVLGGYGVSDDFKAGQMLADAWVGESCDGTRDMLRLGIVEFLKMMKMGPPPGMGGPGGPPPGFDGPPPGFGGPPPGAGPA